MAPEVSDRYDFAGIPGGGSGRPDTSEACNAGKSRPREALMRCRARLKGEEVDFMTGSPSESLGFYAFGVEAVGCAVQEFVNIQLQPRRIV